MKKNAKIYSQALLSLEGSKVLANFVMAIASDVKARNIVDYSERAVFHYQYSSISQMFNGFAPKWSVIASLLRVKSDESAIGVGIAQLQKLCDSLDCKDKLVVNSADSGYGHAVFSAPIHTQKNLVSVVRLKACNVWKQCPRTATGSGEVCIKSLRLAKQLRKKFYNRKKITQIKT